MFRWQSELTSELSENSVKLDINKKGWICIKWSRDSIFDFVVDRGYGVFETVQVKAFSGYKIPTVTRYEPKSYRKTSLYKDYNVTWIAGWEKKTGNIYYYNIETYSKLDDGESIDIRKITPDEFPIWVPPSNKKSRDKNV